MHANLTHRPSVAPSEIDAPRVEVLISYGSGASLNSLTVSMSMESYRSHDGRERELLAARYGVAWDQIAAWSAHEGRIRCIARTRSGRQCKCWVPGVVHQDPASWSKAAEAGGYCFSHQQA